MARVIGNLGAVFALAFLVVVVVAVVRDRWRRRQNGHMPPSWRTRQRKDDTR